MMYVPPFAMNVAAAQCGSASAGAAAEWIQIIQAVGAFATTIGVLTALYIAVVRDPRNASNEHRHHAERMDALDRIKNERAVMQARKFIPSCARIPVFGESWWTVRIDNASDRLTTVLAVAVTAIDSNGFEQPDGCHPANDTVPFDQAFDRAVNAGQSKASDDMTPFKQEIRDALAGHLVDEWPRMLAPKQYAVMAFTTTDPGYELRITVDFEDEAGNQWRRSDTSPPRRADQEQYIGSPPAVTKEQ
jgi:hypothetical protein